MPSPFPGMDPYLEGYEWMSFHAQLIAEIARQLAPRLRPRYFARPERRFVVESFDVPEGVGISDLEVDPDAEEAPWRSAYPDVAVTEQSREHPRPAGLTAAAVSPAPMRLATVMQELAPQHSVEIRDRAQRRLVAVIETLSPANKHGAGHTEYLARRARFLASTAHLMEIDLHRAGRRLPMREPLPAAPYFVLLSRAGRRPETEVWPVALDQPLPTVPVPLDEGDPDVPLDLQAALTAVYDGLGYDLSIDYTRPPETPLAPREAEWAQEALRAWNAARAAQ